MHKATFIVLCSVIVFFAIVNYLDRKAYQATISDLHLKVIARDLQEYGFVKKALDEQQSQPVFKPAEEEIGLSVS